MSRVARERPMLVLRVIGEPRTTSEWGLVWSALCRPCLWGHFAGDGVVAGEDTLALEGGRTRWRGRRLPTPQGPAQGAGVEHLGKRRGHCSHYHGSAGRVSRSPGGPSETGLDPRSSSDPCLGDVVPWACFHKWPWAAGFEPTETCSFTGWRPEVRNPGVGSPALPQKALGRVPPAASGSQGSWSSLACGCVPTSLPSSPAASSRISGCPVLS